MRLWPSTIENSQTIRSVLFERFPCDQVFAIHNQPGIPIGEVSITGGPQLAAADGVTITIQGLGGHAARPHGAIDLVLVGSHIVVALQSIVARRTDPLDSAVISICQFHAGSAGNVILDSVMLNGTIRTLKAETRQAMETLIRQIAESTAAAHGASVEITFRHGYPPMVNDMEAAGRAVAAATRVIPAERIRRNSPPAMARRTSPTCWRSVRAA